MKNHPLHLPALIVAANFLLAIAAAPSWAADGDSTCWQMKAQEVAQARLAGAASNPAQQQRQADAAQAWTPDSTQRAGKAPVYTARELPRFELASDTQPAATDETADALATETQPTFERGPLPSFAETIERDVKELPRLFWHDTKKIFGDPYNLIFLLGAGGASAALRPEVDDDIEDHYNRHHTFRGDWPDTFGAIGNPVSHFSFALAWYAIGQGMQHDKTYEVGKRAFDALTITGLTTMMLKISANTESPNGENLAWPSGHVSSTMALATVLNHAYGPLVGVPMFGLTGLVAVERMDDYEHHFSDVVFGAALGWVVAETIMKEHRPEVFGGEVVPYADLEGSNAGVAWVKTFKP